jgi:tripeptidyl-peptidase-1
MRFSDDLPSMGFINPWLYKVGRHGLKDMLDGSVVGCTGHNPQTNRNLPGAAVIPWASWNSTKGWDPATGLGTPNLRLLAEVYANGTGQACELYE